MVLATSLASCLASCRISEPAGAPAGSMPIPVEERTPPASPDEGAAHGSSASKVEPQKPSPAAAELPRHLPASFSRQQRCAQSPCLLGQWLPDTSYAFSTYEQVPAPAALWMHELDRDMTLALPPHPTLELVVVTLAGALQLKAQGYSERLENKELGEWVALRAPGAGLALDCAAERCQLMVALIATKGTLDAAVIEPARSQRATNKRPGTLETRELASAPTYFWNDGKNHARIVFTGDSPFSLSLLSAAPSVSIPPHSHDSSWENLLVLSSRGELEMRGRPYPLVGGEVIHIPAGVRHAYRAFGAEPLVALQLYTPAGPEQRFIEAAGGTPTPVSGPTRAPEARVAE